MKRFNYSFKMLINKKEASKIVKYGIIFLERCLFNKSIVESVAYSMNSACN